MVDKKKKIQKKESGFDKLARLIKSETDDIRKHMSTKEHVASLYRVMATKEDIAQVYRDMATKSALEEVEQNILEKFKPLERAIDTDALAVVDHGLRIEAIENHLKIKPPEPWTTQK